MRLYMFPTPKNAEGRRFLGGVCPTRYREIEIDAGGQALIERRGILWLHRHWRMREIDLREWTLP